MATFNLLPHAANASPAISRILAIPARRPGGLRLAFRPVGDRDAVRWPPVARQSFADGLWRHTCFEAFVGVPDDPAYVELNIAPSKRWAAYCFDDYRAGMRRAAAAPRRSFVWHRYDATLMADFDLPDLPADRAWQLGLSAVIETLDGARGYFALVHPAGNPDFHNRDCFIATLPPPERA